MQLQPILIQYFDTHGTECGVSIEFLCSSMFFTKIGYQFCTNVVPILVATTGRWCWPIIGNKVWPNMGYQSDSNISNLYWINIWSILEKNIDSQYWAYIGSQCWPNIVDQYIFQFFDLTSLSLYLISLTLISIGSNGKSHVRSVEHEFYDKAKKKDIDFLFRTQFHF